MFLEIYSTYKKLVSLTWKNLFLKSGFLLWFMTSVLENYKFIF